MCVCVCVCVCVRARARVCMRACMLCKQVCVFSSMLMCMCEASVSTSFSYLYLAFVKFYILCIVCNVCHVQYVAHCKAHWAQLSLGNSAVEKHYIILILLLSRNPTTAMTVACWLIVSNVMVAPNTTVVLGKDIYIYISVRRMHNSKKPMRKHIFFTKCSHSGKET